MGNNHIYLLIIHANTNAIHLIVYTNLIGEVNVNLNLIGQGYANPNLIGDDYVNYNLIGELY